MMTQETTELTQTRDNGLDKNVNSGGGEKWQILRYFKGKVQIGFAAVLDVECI